MPTTITLIVIAVLAGAAAYYSWGRNRAVSIASGAICLVTSAIATIAAFVWALGVIFKIIPILLLVAAIWIVYKAFTADKTAD